MRASLQIGSRLTQINRFGTIIFDANQLARKPRETLSQPPNFALLVMALRSSAMHHAFMRVRLVIRPK